MPSTKSQINLNYQNLKSQTPSPPPSPHRGEGKVAEAPYPLWRRGAKGGHLELEFGIYLGFGNWKLEFRGYVA